MIDGQHRKLTLAVQEPLVPITGIAACCGRAAAGPRRPWLPLSLGNHRCRRVSDGALQPKGTHGHAARGLAHADMIDAHHMISDSLPPVLASLMPPDQLELIRQRLLKLPEPERPRLTKRDGLGAIGICSLSFLSTFPIVIPFIVIGDARLALRLSNLIAIGMLLVRICVWPLRRLSTVGHGLGDGRRRRGLGRRCHRSGRLKAPAITKAAASSRQRGGPCQPWLP
jgi:hypothetical protein